MLIDRQIKRMLEKLARYEATLDGLLFEKVDTVPIMAFQTDGKYRTVPGDENFSPCKEGDFWEGEGIYCWFKGQYRIPERYEGQTLFIYPEIEGYEGMLWVNGKPFGNFNTKLEYFSHGNHYCDMLKADAAAGENLDIAMEYYAHHYVIGTKPLEVNPDKTFRITYHKVNICLKNEAVWDFYFNLKIVNQMVSALNENSFRRAGLINVLKQVHEIVYYDYENVDQETFYRRLSEANRLLKQALRVKNSASAPYAGLIGHSHMDTAWLWETKETVKKCARTYSNQMSLMQQYPKYKFIQSSAYHSRLIQKYYPELFEDMKAAVAAGRYEPNGGVWIECDCNIPWGEMIIRQFLWGQRFTRENFNYTSDCFWLPDTFGYSASIPQIMKGCKVDYFLTTKIKWCDTTNFPYDTFYWKGIDGTQVFVHFNKTHTGPGPEDMLESLENSEDDSLMEKTVTNMRLLSYGRGDGGGGPEFEELEMADRLEDVEGLPRSGYTTVSDFMKQLEKTAVEPNIYNGELYLELHRGTLTNQHDIKRNNRLAEIELRNLEYVTVRDAIKHGRAASGSKIHPLMETLLVHQFHDILPGTCIPQANEQTVRETAAVIARARDLTEEILQPAKKEGVISVRNTLSFDREDVIYLDSPEGYLLAGNYKQQMITDLKGSKKLAVSGAVIPAFSAEAFEFVTGTISGTSLFRYEDAKLETPFFTVEFDARGFISSLIDKRVRRELRGDGYALNTFLIAEDVPADYDNWDLDADCECKFEDRAKLLSRNVVSDGEVEFRIRSEYKLTEKSVLRQDMIFYGTSPEVRFDTVIDWQDTHRFLKTAFDTAIHADFARHEIQFGYIERSTNRNTAAEKAKFEVTNHKYTDLSETRYGAAILNDCKYGITAKDSKLRLSLHKGGNRPDYRGDKGVHECCYSFYPHEGAFGADSVIKPAYMLNYKPLVCEGILKEDSFVKVSSDNILIEAVKPPEDAENAYILRIYEAEGTYTNTRISFTDPVKGLALTNMLEEVTTVLPPAQEIELTFGAFEIKTLKVNY